MSSPSKLVMSVRFRSPAFCPALTAPVKKCLTLPVFKGYGDISWHFWSFILHYNCQQMPRNDTACTNSLRVLLRAQIKVCFEIGQNNKSPTSLAGRRNCKFVAPGVKQILKILSFCTIHIKLFLPNYFFMIKYQYNINLFIKFL